MLAIIRSIWALLFAIALLMVGNGLQGSLLSLRATIEGFGLTLTGAVMSAFYVGFLFSSFITPRLIESVGHIRVFAAFASLGSTTVLLHPLFPDPYLWLALRFVTGCSIAGLFVVTESWLNHASDNETRGQTLSLYMVTVHAFMALGQAILSLTDPAQIGAFILVSILVSLALIPVSLTRAPAPYVEYPRPISLRELYEASPLGFSTCLLVGFAQGSLLGMGAVYANQIGLSTARVGILMSLPLLAVVATQYPIGLVSDRIDRRKVILTVALLSAVLAIAGVVFGARDFGLLLIIFALYGGLSAPLYSLAIAHTNDHLDPSAMVGASARMVFVYGIGSVIGPLFVGVAMSFAGAGAFFVFAAAVHLTMGGIALWRMTQRGPVPQADRGEYVNISVRATPIAAVAAVEDAEEAL